MAKEKEHSAPNNKSIRLALIKVYGNRCMFLKAHIPERLKGTIIKSYRKFKKEMHYTFKQIQELEGNLTLHHLRHEADGGELTPHNGAIVNELAHRYIHSLPREQEEVINDMLREYKSSFRITGGLLTTTEKDLELLEPFGFDLDIQEEGFIEIPLTD